MPAMASVVQKAHKLSHKAFRALLKKFRRKKKRREIAIAREQQELLEQKQREASPGYKEREEERRRNSELWEQFQETDRIRKHKEWLWRESEAQAQFKRKKLLEEQEKIRREKEKEKMLAEIEQKNLLETVTAEYDKKAKEKKEETLQEALSGLPEGNGPWHNPLAPENYNAGAEQEQCSFFAKTGCCRFGERCSRGHLYPEVSTTLLIKGMYSHFSIEQGVRDDYDTDMGLEFEDRETYQDFKSFYDDVLPEFKKCGRVLQFKVCCNHEPHLRGNVYVQFSREEYAVEAFKKFNGRFYAGKQLSCEFANITNWKSAICGLFMSKRCPKGNNCNFLHVFRNPTNEFWAADRNLPDHPGKRPNSSSRSNGQRFVYPRSNESSRRSHRHSSSSYHSSSTRHRDSHSDSSEDEYHSRRRESRSESHEHSSRHQKKRRRRSSSGSHSPTPDSSHRKHKKSKRKMKKKRQSSSPSS